MLENPSAFLGPRERRTLTTPRVTTFADLRTSEIHGEIGRRIVDQLTMLSQPHAQKDQVQAAIRTITQELLAATFPRMLHDRVLLVPVLRSGIAMWGEANDYFGAPETSFVTGVKEKGTDQVTLQWPKKHDATDKEIIILDPIIATGDTIVEVSKQFDQPVTIVACYAAPEGVASVLERTNNTTLIVGCMAQTVDEDGYLIPPTHGDMGDKLFGTPLIS